jgi:hypothetical protein
MVLLDKFLGLAVQCDDEYFCDETYKQQQQRLNNSVTSSVPRLHLQNVYCALTFRFSHKLDTFPNCSKTVHSSPHTHK